MFRVKRGPVLFWTVTTTVQRTNERVAGIVGSNPVVIKDYYNVAVFEVKIIAQTNLALTRCVIFGSLTGTAASPTVGFPPAGSAAWTFCILAPTIGALQGVNEAAISLGELRDNQDVAWDPGLIVPPALLLEYSTAAPGATPNLQFEIRGFFVGAPFFGVDP